MRNERSKQEAKKKNTRRESNSCPLVSSIMRTCTCSRIKEAEHSPGVKLGKLVRVENDNRTGVAKQFRSCGLEKVVGESPKIGLDQGNGSGFCNVVGAG